ncbi:hypothetical protein VTK73DRAFT_5825 [Phialemonium thermophilum]|uniref:Uncharacterized protein n=1 Tax=Phialemonium thermophilum TaxID=223376 RepID=A0ABR3V0F2_9PEZI
MASAAVQNPPAPSESKSAKKKKAKTAAERTESPAPVSSAATDKAVSVSGNDASNEETGENPYIRDLQNPGGLTLSLVCVYLGASAT